MKKTIAILFMLSALYSFAQPGDKQPPTPFIEVTGTAVRLVAADRIFITIVLSDKTVDNRNYTIETQEANMKEALKRINIDLRKLVLSDATSEIVRTKRKESGVRITKEFVLEVKNSEEVSNVFKELYALNIRESSISKLESSMIDSIRKEVRIDAIKAAKAKAEYLVAAIGEKLDRPLEIREQPEFQRYAVNIANTSSPQPGEDYSDNSVNFQEFTVKFSYYIKYSLK